MTQKEKLYITRILTDKRAEQKRLINSVLFMDAPERLKNDSIEMLIDHINAIDKAIELLDK
ncbi:MAG: hypothetical protein ACI4J6_12835 [Oscillospiraceae bacterium]